MALNPVLAIVNIVLIKILVIALAFSQVSTRPEAIKTYFDPAKDTAEIATLLNAGCAHMRRSFDLELIDLDGLVATAMDDAQPLGEDIKAFKGLSIRDLHGAYRQFCKAETDGESAADLGQVAAFYNDALKDLPDVGKLKGMRLPQMSLLLDRKGAPFAELYRDNHRRLSVPIAEIPPIVRNAFIAVEDRRFFQHTGSMNGGSFGHLLQILRNRAVRKEGRPSHSRLPKTSWAGNDVTYDRKI